MTLFASQGRTFDQKGKIVKRKTSPPQFDLFGHPIDKAMSTPSIIPLDFESHAIRMIMIKTLPWWVAADVCRALDIVNSRDAINSLDDDEKGVANADTLGGAQDLNVVNESGLYALIFKSRKEEAKRFRKWVTSEVLPSIRKHGSYRIGDRSNATARRLKCDQKTAVARERQVKLNKSMHGRLKAEGACQNDYRELHNSVYRGQFGMECSELRKPLGLKPSQTPLDHMDYSVLVANEHAKASAEKQIRMQAIALDDQPEIYEKTAREIAESDLKRMGTPCIYGITDDPKRGKILDIVPLQLNN